MAESSTSSLTSTSHTLTVAAPIGSMASLPSLGDIASVLAFRDAQKHRAAFLKPASSLPIGSTQFTQVALGTFAGQIGEEQQERLRQLHAAAAARKKRKRTGQPADGLADKGAVGPAGPLLKLRRVHVDGFEIPQVWQQSNRILTASLQQSKFGLEQLDEEDEDDEETQTNGVKAGSDSEEDDEEEELAALAALIGEEENEEGEDDEEEEDDDELSMGEDDEDDFDEDGEEEEEDDDDEELDNQPRKELVEDKDGLNDGFFDLNDFNKQSQWFEAQDARADPNTDAVSEDEDLDWHADPFSAAGGKKNKKAQSSRGGSASNSKKNGRGQLYSDDDDQEDAGQADDEEDEDEEDGPPIFGDMDLDAPSGASDDEDDLDNEGGLASGLDMDLTANDIFYKDFFAPPARKRGDRDRPGRPSASAYESPFQPEEQDVQRAINAVRRDLFEQISDASGDEGGNSSDIDALSDASAGDVRSRRSAHERRQAKILAEIRSLEADAVKQKNWTVAGEASAGARPLNSLLEEDLDFEHIGKPVPVITQEVTEDIEALVKRRILEQSFDEVRRRYGTGFGEGGEEAARRGLVEIDDQPGKKGLSAVYEAGHEEAANPDAYVRPSDERLAAEEREVERMWLDVSTKLDALSNWHYKPRPAAPGLSVVADVGTVAMEDAQPATAQGVSGGASMLAPQEVYKPGAGKAKDKNIVVVAKSGLPVARDEMTREDKKRRRRRNKERIRKSGSGVMNGGAIAATNGADGADEGNGASAGGKAQKASQQDTLATLKRSGVKVIGRKGELQDLEGNKPQAAQAISSGNYKL